MKTRRPQSLPGYAKVCVCVGGRVRGEDGAQPAAWAASQRCTAISLLGLNAPCSLGTECSSESAGVPGPRFPEAQEQGKDSQGASHYPPLPHPCPLGPALVSRAGSTDTAAAQAIAEISSTHLVALQRLGEMPERRVHLLPARLSSELLIAPASGKIITETDSCYLKSQQ